MCQRREVSEHLRPDPANPSCAALRGYRSLHLSFIFLSGRSCGAEIRGMPVFYWPPPCCKTNSPSAVRAEARVRVPSSLPLRFNASQIFAPTSCSVSKTVASPRTNSSHYHWWFPKTTEDAPPIAQGAASVLQAKHAQMDARAPTAPQEKVCRRRRRNDVSAAAPACLLRS
jgi:hypothetical protein